MRALLNRIYTEIGPEDICNDPDTERFVIFCSLDEMSDLAIAVWGYCNILRCTECNSDTSLLTDFDYYDHLYEELSKIPDSYGWLRKRGFLVEEK